MADEFSGVPPKVPPLQAAEIDSAAVMAAWMKLVLANQLETMRGVERLVYEAKPIGHPETCQRLAHQCNDTFAFMGRWP